MKRGWCFGHFSSASSRTSYQGSHAAKELGDIQTGAEEEKLSTDNVILYVEKPNGRTHTLLRAHNRDRSGVSRGLRPSAS